MWPANPDAQIDMYRRDGTLDVDAVDRALSEILGLRTHDADRILRVLTEDVREQSHTNLILEALT